MTISLNCCSLAHHFAVEMAFPTNNLYYTFIKFISQPKLLVTVPVDARRFWKFVAAFMVLGWICRHKRAGNWQNRRDGVNHFQTKIHDAIRGVPVWHFLTSEKSEYSKRPNAKGRTRVTKLLKHFQCIHQQPTFSSVWHTLLPACSVHVHTHDTKINGKACHSHTHAHALSFLFSLNSDLLGSDLWHLHTSDLEGGGGHTQPRTQTRSNAEPTDGKRADSKRSTPRCLRASVAAAVRRGGLGEQEEEEDEKSNSGLYPRRSLKSMQPKENQSALLSYAVPFWRTSGAM